MRRPRVVAARPFRFKPINYDLSQQAGVISAWWESSVSLFFLLVFCHLTALAGEGEGEPPKTQSPSDVVPGYLVRVEQNKPEEVEAALLRVEAFYLEGSLFLSQPPPVALVLHGPEVEIFLRANYRRYKRIIDLAARLSALEQVDIKICRTRLRFLEQDAMSLFPFVSTVAFGPDEIARLTNEEGYVRF